jgi:hypothetical protein
VLDRALDELYTVAPDEFVATRARLVAELRGEAENEAAKELGSARRPTVAAWALNQVAHRERSLIDELLRLSGALRDAQQRAVAGDAGDLRDATRAQREVLERVLGSAIAIAGSGAATNVATQIGGTLQAASTSADAGEMLRQGRLVKELQPSSGFPGGDSAVDAPARAPRRAPAGAPKAPSVDREAAPATADVADLEQARARRAARERAEQDLETARAELDEARAAVDAAAVEVDQTRVRADELARDAAAAKEASRHAQRELVSAKRQADRLAAAVARLERLLPPTD